MPLHTRKIWKNRLDPTLVPGVDPALSAVEEQRHEDAIADLKWHLVYDVKGKEFGAAGNGVADDTAEIQDAIDTAAANGGDVFIPAGTYLISAELNLATGVSIFGTGRGSVIKIKSATDIDAIDLNSAYDFTLSNFAIDCNKAGNPTGSNGTAIKGSATQCKLKDLWIVNSKKHGIDGSMSFICSIDRCWIEADIFPVQLALVDSWFTHNYCVCTGTPTNDGRSVFSGGPFSVEGCHFQGGRYSVFMYPPQDVRFINNFLEFSHRELLRLEYPSGYGDGGLRWQIIGNEFKHASNQGTGLYPFVSLIGFDATHRIGDTGFTANTFLKGTTTPTYAVDLLNAINIRGEGNIWRGAYGGGSAVNAGAGTSLIAINGG